MSAHLIGIDLGTQGTKACLFLEDGTPVAQAFEPSELISRAPGHVEQDPDALFGSVVRTIRQVMERGGVALGDVACVGMDGQMAGIMGIGADGGAVTPYDSWLDTRCEPQIERMKREAGERVIQISGAPPTYAHAPKVLWWQQERPEVYRRIRKFVLPVPYIAGRLCGFGAEGAYIDYTNLHFSGFGDVLHLNWSDELLDVFGVDGNKMPRIVEPWHTVGHLTSEAAALCGLLPGTPVAAGAGDQAATSLGAGIVRPGLAFDVAGTASVFSCCTDQYAPDVAHRTILFARSVMPDLWIPLAYINGGGLCVRWIRDALGASYDELAAEAEPLPPGSEDLLFTPHFAGRVCPNDPLARGSFAGLTLRHGRGHLYRAVLESIGYEYQMYRSILAEATGLALDEVHAIGGGAKSGLFNQIKADILGIRYTTLQAADTGPLGAMIIAGRAVGLYPDIAEAASRLIRRTNTIEPNLGRHALYGRYAALYPELLDALRPIYQKLS